MLRSKLVGVGAVGLYAWYRTWSGCVIACSACGEVLPLIKELRMLCKDVISLQYLHASDFRLLQATAVLFIISAETLNTRMQRRAGGTPNLSMQQQT
jgi:hypothetical protein